MKRDGMGSSWQSRCRRNAHAAALAQWLTPVLLVLLLALTALPSGWAQLSLQPLPWSGHRSPAEWAPGRLIIKLQPAAAAALAHGLDSPALSPSLRGVLASQKVSRFRPLFPHLRAESGGHGAAAQAASIRAQFPARSRRAPSSIRVPDLETAFLLDIPSARDPRTVAAVFEADPSVVYAEPDQIVHASLVPDDPYYGSSGAWGQSYQDLWGLYRMNAEAAWEVTTGTDAITIAVIDSGIDASHPDLAGRVLPGRNFVDKTDNPADGYGHGTHVAGTIAAASNNGLGITGLCWQGKLLPLKGLDDRGAGYISDLAQALVYAADNGADVANCSWGGLGYSETMQEAVDYASSLGCLVVAAAGNDAMDAKYHNPASLRNVVCVAATDPADQRASFSNFGDVVDVSAPGVDILSLRAADTDLYGDDGAHVVGNNYYRASGTSMASPHGAGALALLVAAHPDWPISALVERLLATSDDIDSANPDYAGKLGLGRINLARALSGPAPDVQRLALVGCASQGTLGSPDGYALPGERIQLRIDLKHFTGVSPGLTATLTTADPFVSLVSSQASFGDVSGWCRLDNSAAPFVFDVAPVVPEAHHRLSFTLTVAAAGFSLVYPIDVVIPESVAELWRSPFGHPFAVAVNATDGSGWMAADGQVLHVSSAGDLLSVSAGFTYPRALAVNPTDGSCWVADSAEPVPPPFKESISRPYGGLVHLAADGSRLPIKPSLPAANGVAVNPTDGSVWVADGFDELLAHLSADGTILWQSTQLGASPLSVSVNPADGSCWMGGLGAVLHLSADGSVLSRNSDFPDPVSVAVDPRDGSCWVSDACMCPTPARNIVAHLSAAGDVLWTSPQGMLISPQSLTVLPDGSCVVASTFGPDLVRFAADGSEIWKQTGFSQPVCVAASSADGTLLVGDGSDRSQLVSLQPDGTERWRRADRKGPLSIAASVRDGGCWIIDFGTKELLHLSEAGEVLWRSRDGSGQSPFAQPELVAVDSNDGSCWMADRGTLQVVYHLAADGSVLWNSQIPAFSLSVNQSDSSCWVLNTPDGRALHLAGDGTVLWSGGNFRRPGGLSVDSGDGSCWVADTSNNQVVHLSPSGQELLRFTVPPATAGPPVAVSANPADGSCWVACGTSVLHLASDGAVLSMTETPDGSLCLSVNPSDGSCWVGTANYVLHLSVDGDLLWSRIVGEGLTAISVDWLTGACWVALRNSSQVLLLAPPGYRPPAFVDVPRNHWALASIEACVAAGIVMGYSDGTYRPGVTVTRDQMAVYVSRALAGGDSHVPPGPVTASFSDVPTAHWAFKYVEYAKANNIVQGYWDGYHPGEDVTRDQMAVYIARATVNPTGEGGLISYTPPATPSFTDVPADRWAYKHIEYCHAQGIVQGYWDGYHPGDVVTRDQMAVYVQRAFRLPM